MINLEGQVYGDMKVVRHIDAGTLLVRRGQGGYELLPVCDVLDEGAYDEFMESIAGAAPLAS